MTHIAPVPHLDSPSRASLLGPLQFAFDASDADPTIPAARDAAAPDSAGNPGPCDLGCADRAAAPQQIAETIRQRLAASPYRELHGIQVRIDAGRVELEGQATTFYLKQMAQEITRRAAPTLRVINQVRVVECSICRQKPR